MSISRFTTLFAIISLISPIASLAQSEFTEGTRAAATPKNEYIVSVQELRMSDKGRKAFEKGVALLGKGDAAASLAYFDRAIAEFPGFYQAHYDLGIAHFGFNHLVEAERSVRQALVRRAKFAQAYFLLARIHQRQNNSPAVVEDLEAYLKLDPHSRASEQARAILKNPKSSLAVAMLE